MRDDWRLRVRFEAESTAQDLLVRLEAFELEHDLGSSFRSRVIVSRDGPLVFCYTESREHAEAAERMVEQLAAQHSWRVETVIERWHPAAERWDDASVPLAQSPEELREEHAALIERERQESIAQGYPIFEVRVSCPSPDDARALAERLGAEGIPTAQRWQFVAVGAADEDSARELADRLRAEAPPGSTIQIGGSIAEVTTEAPFATPFSPFAVFGGLAN